MQCMKCGRDLESGEVFCRECREVMEKYPVKPGTVVQLHHRQIQYAAKRQSPRRKAVPLEEQVELLKKVSRRLAMALAVATLISLIAGYVAVTQFVENQRKQAVGQNYSVIATQAPTAAVEQVSETVATTEAAATEEPTETSQPTEVAAG